MTTADERARAVDWGGQLLAQIADGEGSPDDLRKQARMVLAQYPTPAHLLELVQANVPQLPLSMVEALAAAAALLGQINRLGIGDEGFKRDLWATLRHYPDEAVCELMAHPFARYGLCDWLLPLGTLEPTASVDAENPDADRPPEHLVNLHLGRLAIDTFETEPEAAFWLRKPHPMLAGNAPLEHARTWAGLRAVEALLAVIKYGGVA